MELATLPANEERAVLMLAALYHDVIYDPTAPNNEEASAELLRAHAVDPDDSVITGATELIIASKWEKPPEGKRAQILFDLDTRQLAPGRTLAERLAYEMGVYREYQWVPDQVYRTKRVEFLQSWAQRFPQHRKGVEECLELLAAFRPRLAVYPGSFHPFHTGHLSILRQAEQAFDKVIVAVGVNRQKSGAPLSVTQRHEVLREQLRFHEVAVFEGLLSSYLDTFDLPIMVVRGIRNGTDLEAELRYVRFLNELRSPTGVIWISCQPEYQHLSSSSIRELEAIAPGAGRRYVPAAAEIYNFGVETR